MNESHTEIKRALISVSDKTGIVAFAKVLVDLGIELISTGGTSQALRAANIPVRDVADITAFPEMMDGRVKTLHPKIHGGILGQRDVHASAAKMHDIGWIDLVVVNLYPFHETIQNPTSTWNDAIENIDIGGPTLIRAAAKNMGWVSVIVDPTDYEKINVQLKNHRGLDFITRQQLATKAFAHTAHYDTLIHQYLNKNTFPDMMTLPLTKQAELRYGENPHQTASAYTFTHEPHGILSARQHQGKQLSYNNITDADAALACVGEFSEPACVIVKHANPCGVSVADTLEDAFYRAYHADSLSAFGGIVAFNRPCNKAMAEKLVNVFIEVLVAPSFSEEALTILATKPNLRVLEIAFTSPVNRQEFKFITGGLLVQEKDNHVIHDNALQVMTHRQPTPLERQTMLFAWRVIKHIKSNAILLAQPNVTIGVGSGSVSRIDALETAMRKGANQLMNSILASDAFFPFRDTVDRLANTGVRAIIQPGGSIKDDDVIKACNDHDIAMVFTGTRCFKH